MSIADLVAHSGGSAELALLLRHATRHQVRRAVADGEIVRVARGVYALPCLTPGALAAARAGGALCLEAAAVSWGLPVLGRPESVTVTIALPRGTKRLPTPGVTYRRRELSADELAEGRTGLLRTVLDCAAVLPLPQALAVVDGALRDSRVPRARLVQAAEELRGPRRVRRLQVVRAADGRAANPFESAVRALLIEAGITGFEPQVLIRAPGFEARVDLAHRRKRVVIEADGFEYHAATPPAFNRDVRRYTELVRHDWRLLRFTWQQVMAQPHWVVETVRATLTGATTPPQPDIEPFRPATIRRRP